MASERLDSEDAIIGAFFAPLARGFKGSFDLADDCAAIAPEPGTDLIVTTDAVTAGVHVFADEDPAAIAWKALSVNVSDLTAKGATPLAYVMMLALPDAPQRAWLSAFCEGLSAAQDAFGCHLIGGDTDRTPGPLSVAITAFGSVPAGRMVRRSGARCGDLVYVSGTIGDAALGLALRRDPTVAARWALTGEECEALDRAYCRPQPPVALRSALLEHASGAMDVSDGLVKDFDRMCRSANAGGVIEAERVPLSPAARKALGCNGVLLADLVTGGEDYQVLASVAPDSSSTFETAAHRAGLAVARVGTIAEAAAGVRVLDASGKELAITSPGWDHFAP